MITNYNIMFGKWKKILIKLNNTIKTAKYPIIKSPIIPSLIAKCKYKNKKLKGLVYKLKSGESQFLSIRTPINNVFSINCKERNNIASTLKTL
jgi:hypothetical protein